MALQDPKKAGHDRCIGLLAHVDAGKTTLSEAILYTTGTTRKLGRVDNRDAYLDTYALERERGITIFSKQAVCQLGDITVTLLDTPGHVDFSAEMERTDHIEQVLGSVAFQIPHSEELYKQVLEGNLFQELSLKESRPFRRAIDDIIKEVFDC